MSVISVFLDKNKYYSNSKHKGIIIDGFEIKNLADIIRFYLSKTPTIDTIYIAGGCYGKKISDAETLVRSCFGNPKIDGTKKYEIYLIRKYAGFSYNPTDDAIINNNHIYDSKFDTKKSDHRKMIFFESEKRIVAVLIGSSNYSHRTYLTKAAAEADLLMVDNTTGKGSVINHDFIDTVKSYAIAELNGGGSITNDFDTLINKVLISESLNGDGFIEEIFEDIVNDSKIIKAI